MHISDRPRPDTKLTGALSLPALRQSRRAVWVVAAAVVLAAAAVVVPKLFATPAVPVATVTSKAAERVLAVTGRIRPRESVQVVPRIAGQVKELTRREGEAVNAGDILGRIDDARGRTAVAQALAAADAQRRILDQAERDLTRAQSLRERGNGTQTTVETATLSVARGREDLRRLIAAADEAKLRLEEYLIVAPLTGRLLTRPVDRGQVVDGKTTLFEIAPTGDREIETEVDETYSVEVALGQVARLSFPSNAAVVEGRVSYLSPRIDTTTGGRVVRIAFPEPSIELPVGLTVDVNIVIERNGEALMVPRTAIRDAATAPSVQVVNDGKVEKRAIVFKDWPSAMVMVSQGLKSGDNVVLGSPQVEGSTVKTTSAPGRR